MFDSSGLRMALSIIATLLLLPMVFVTVGFVASSTLLFAVAATTLRASKLTAGSIAIDLAVGAMFSITLFLVFTRGLGVTLPGFF